MKIHLLGTGGADGIPSFFGASELSTLARERGGKDIRTIQRSGFKLVRRPPIELVDWQALEQPTG